MSINNQKGAEVYCGIDFHKNTSTLCMIDKEGRDVEPLTTIKTSNLTLFLSNRRHWKIGIEASGGVNHVVEQLKSDGHEVLCINSNKFRGIGIGGKKTDERDARALAEALRLGFIPEVHHRSRYSREIKSLLMTRELAVRARVNGINHVRGILREYGIVINASVESFFEQARVKIDEVPNGHIKNSLHEVLGNIYRYREQENAVEESLKAMTIHDERLKRLQTIPGVGLMTSLMMIAVIDDIGRFPNAKEFASYLGLVPSVHASANKSMMGSITRSGSEVLRRYLIHGARAWMRYNSASDRNRLWAEKVKERRGVNKAVVALAHKMARISFAILRDDSNYRESKKKKLVA